VFSVYGYSLVDLFLRTASKAGPNLTTDSFIKAMDTMTIPPDMFGSAEMTGRPHPVPAAFSFDEPEPFHRGAAGGACIWPCVSGSPCRPVQARCAR